MHEPRPAATLPLAATGAVPTRTTHFAVPDETPAPVSTRITGAETTTSLPAFGLAGTTVALPAFNVTGSSLSLLSVDEEQPGSAASILPSPSSSLPFAHCATTIE